MGQQARRWLGNKRAPLTCASCALSPSASALLAAARPASSSTDLRIRSNFQALHLLMHAPCRPVIQPTTLAHFLSSSGSTSLSLTSGQHSPHARHACAPDPSVTHLPKSATLAMSARVPCAPSAAACSWPLGGAKRWMENMRRVAGGGVGSPQGEWRPVGRWWQEKAVASWASANI